jgi:hypothetical protein
MEQTARRRSGSFHEDDDVQFLTPHYEADGPEPLDLSKLDLDAEDDDYDEDEEERQHEMLMTRGRSRSRSVHANDDNNNEYLPDTVEKPSTGPKTLTEEQLKEQLAAKTKSERPVVPLAADRTGPLQHREVVALQKVSVIPFSSFFLSFFLFSLLLFRDWKKQHKL